MQPIVIYSQGRFLQIRNQEMSIWPFPSNDLTTYTPRQKISEQRIMNQFEENMCTAVFTTKYVLEKKSPIIHVYHFDEDGAWQFLSSEEIEADEDFRIVSLEEII